MKTAHKFSYFIALVALIVAIAVAVSIWSFDQIQQATDVRKQNSFVLDKANALLSSLKDAETDQRGYLLTGDEAFLQPYLAARNSVGADLNELRKINSNNTASIHLDAIAVLIDAKMQALAHLIELRRENKIAALTTEMRKGHGKRLMDSIRAEMLAFTQIQQSTLAKNDVALESNMHRMFNLIIFASLLWSLFALAFIYIIYRQSQQKLENLLHVETQQLLQVQEDTNKKLQQLNITLQDSEEKLAVTLNSIGDAVITTDAKAIVTLLNPLAEQLTGWTQVEAAGRPISEIFPIINKETRLSVAIPVMETLAHGTIQGLANHTVLIARDGSECDIADSCAPIRNRDGQVVGAVLVFRNVSEEYAIQQALRNTSVQIQTILNTVADGIITLHARDGIIETANPSALRMFGYTPAELTGRNFSELIPELDQEKRNGSLQHYSASDEARAIGLGREVIGWRKGNSSFPLEIAVSEMRLGDERYFTCILRDITTRRQVEEALIKAGALQNAIFNSANFSSIATDAKGVIQIFNVGAERMLGYSATDVMNKITPAEISDPEEIIARAETLSIELNTPIKPGFDALVFKASRGIEDIYELTYICKDGSHLPAVVSVTALRDDQNTIIGYLLIGTDNTVRKQIEAERTLLDQALQVKNAELERARQIADKANLAKSDFLSSMSHELRTPLGAILGFAQLIESGTPQPTPTQKKSIDQILKAGWYLLELINEVLDLALIESGKLSLSLEPVFLKDLLLECEAMIEPQAQKRGINVTFTKPEIAYCVNGDRTRMKQVLINLLSNAIKYNKENGSVTVDCKLTPNDSLRISVQDTGAGLTPEQLTQLFQPFNRLGQNEKEEGTGIGLVVCKRLIDLMKGKIGVESTVGTGSIFWIELDLSDASQSKATTTESRSNVVNHEKVHGDAHLRTLLYVEDNPANLMLVEEIIARCPDIRLLSAVNAKQGVKLARTSLPDVILMDINLPGLSGLDALKMLVEDPETAHIPVVALSANAMPHDIEKGLEAGFFRYLTKPIKVTEFMATLDLALKFAKTEAALATQKE
ncbi:PAS domain S-box protein [Methylotenera sp.]|uniref:PAS domain S-box protein n=1 Tax=Methylotenera sp. TaxID=2051956 RepID=UPI00272F02BE|nr:PAS domain S-box protein [Methylotenera sp.]MDP2231803.1 PAS domain S-box protein [Methylotenera sp.]